MLKLDSGRNDGFVKRKSRPLLILLPRRPMAVEKMVGLVRFELTTSCTPCKRATRLRYSPNKEGSQSDTPADEARVFSARNVGGALRPDESPQLRRSTRLRV